MRSLNLLMTCLDDIVLSQSAATTGGHRSLDHIPGATLLGASAAVLYDALGQRAFDVFHSGKVRFGNALPADATGTRANPVPLSWHHAKGESVHDEQTGLIEPNTIFNFAHTAHGFPEGAQPKQMRAGYVTADGKLLAVERNFRLKTAIDNERGAAAESQLFGYESIRSGAQFIARIDCDDDIPEDLWQRIAASLVGNLRIGRSRGAQYGRVRSESLTTPGISAATVELSGNRLVLWLQSDLAAIDDMGQPALAPAPQWLGLPVGRLVTEASFVQTRRYSPYHGKRRTYDVERQTIRQGSVLTFLLDAPIDASGAAAIRDRLASGIGLYREQGLGQAQVNPGLLVQAHPAFLQVTKPPARSQSDSRKHAAPPTPFTRWLSGPSASTDRSSLQSWARDRASEALALYESVARFEGYDDDELLRAGPSLSQWGRLEQLAKASGNDHRAIYDALFLGDSAICKPADDQWKRIGSLGSERISFRDWLARQLLREPPPSGAGQLATGRTVALLAETIRRTLGEHIESGRR